MEPLSDQGLPGTDPERVVVECCAAGTPAVVTFRESGGNGLRAVFTAFRNERVEFEMTDDPPREPADGTVCHVSFLHRGRPVTFTAPLRSAEVDRGRMRVQVGLPGQISSEGLRSAFRLPGGSGPNDVDLVADDGITWPAELVNLSLTGMLLRFAGDAPTLMPDQVVELSVKVAEEHVRLAGVVRRVTPDEVGIFFPDAVSDSPENPIRCVVAALERDWHSRLRR
ncbi:MAG: PilZ domain-containing protein [Deltaproteobacteria bacterium]|nr:PilZ domain-containing protein [Deltaproteobacteria bacterium]MBW2445288.1 PilZ domain-containing protein [Deltaproteobacteria bacterium]